MLLLILLIVSKYFLQKNIIFHKLFYYIKKFNVNCKKSKVIVDSNRDSFERFKFNYRDFVKENNKSNYRFKSFKIK